MLNKVMLIGRLTKDVELKQTNTGLPVANFSIATDKFTKGEKKAEFHNIVVWEKTAENCAKFLSKGKLVYIEGEIQTRKWQDKTDGKDRYATEIIGHKVQFLSPVEKTDQAPNYGSSEDIPL